MADFMFTAGPLYSVSALPLYPLCHAKVWFDMLVAGKK